MFDIGFAELLLIGVVGLLVVGPEQLPGAVRTVLEGSDSLTILPLSVVFMLRKQQPLSALSVRIDHPQRSLGILSHKAVPNRPQVERIKRFVRNEFRALSATIAHQEQNSIWRK